MSLPDSSTAWLAQFPELAAIDDEAWLYALKYAKIVNLSAGKVVFRPGEGCENYILVLEGSIKVQSSSPSGQEIILYRITQGHFCELTTSCLVGGACYPAEAVAESDVKAVYIPRVAFLRAFKGSEVFRAFVLRTVDQGMSGLVDLIQDIVFGDMKQRLARKILEKCQSCEVLELTHKDLAVDLGTAREVVSRLLKQFEKSGWVRLHRGRLDIVDREALEAFCEQQ